MASKPAHQRFDSAVVVPARAHPTARTPSTSSFTAEEFAKYEKRLSISRPQTPIEGSMPQQPEPAHRDAIVKTQEVVQVSGGFSSKDLEAYEKRLSATTIAVPDAFEKAPALEAGVGKPKSKHQRNVSEWTVMTTTSAFYEDTILPEKRQSRLMRHARHSFLNVYRRLFSLVFIGNVVALLWLTIHNRTINLPVEALATAASANICVAILIRQEYIVNFLYAACLAVPLSAPLRLRRLLAKVYENGGIHSGAAIAGTIWFTLLTIVISYQFAVGQLVLHSVAVLVMTYVLIVVLYLILVFAYPRMRNLTHNTFEFTHRFAGWSAIGIFWADLILLAYNTHYSTHEAVGHILIRMPTFWFLIIITFHLVLPWVLLRKVKFETENLSNHAVRLNFTEKLSPFRGVALATSPLGQYHSFATFPNTDAPNKNGQSIIISSAGDWTKAQVSNVDQARHYWLRGVPKTGVLGMATIFRSVVIVTTGSGIGPCLAFINLPQNLRRPCRVIWSTPRPEQIYGKGIIDMVHVADPEAIIWDTKVSGRPDMVKMTYELFKQSDAEAVFVISNPTLTRKIVFGMESRGVPAFGPIWDS